MGPKSKSLISCANSTRFLLFLVLLCSTLFCSTEASQAAGTETLIGIVGKDFILLGADSSVSQSISLTASNLDKIAPLSEPNFYDCDDSNICSPCIVAAAAGNAAASDRLVTMLQAYATMEEYAAGLGSDVDYVHGSSLSAPGLDVEAMANLARSQIAGALRSQTPYQVCLLIAGMMHSTMDASDKGKSAFLAKRVQQQVLTSSWEDTSETIDTSDDGIEKSTSTTIPLAKDSLEPRLYWLDEYGSSQSLQYGAHGHGANFCLSILDQGFSEDMDLDQALALMKNCFEQLRTRYVINSPQPPCVKCVDKKGIRLIR